MRWSAEAYAKPAATLLLISVVVCGCADVAGDRLVVSSGFTDQVFVLDAGSGRVLDSLSLDRRPGERDEPHGLAVSGDGQHLYATLSHGEASLWKYETKPLRLVGRLTLTTRGASRVRLSPDGSTAAVPDYWLSGGGQESQVAFVRTHDLSVAAAPHVCPAPHDAAFSPDGGTVAVVCTLSNEVVLLSAADFSEQARYGTGTRPLNAAWTPSGDSLFVTLNGASAIALLSGLSGDSFPELTPGSAHLVRLDVERPAQAAVAPDGSRLVVANRAGQSVSVQDLAGGDAAEISIPGPHPHGVAFGPAGHLVYVTYEGDTESRGGVVAIDLETNSVVWHTELGLFTLGVAYLPAANR